MDTSITAISMEQRVMRVLGAFVGLPADTFKPEQQLEDIGLDSLDKVELAMDLEDELGVVLDDKQTDNIQTVQQLIDAVREKA